MGIHVCIPDRVAVNRKMLHGGFVERAAVLALELRKWQRHELRRRRLCEAREIDLEILTVRVQLADELLPSAVRRHPELDGVVRRPIDTAEALHDAGIAPPC